MRFITLNKVLTNIFIGRPNLDWHGLAWFSWLKGLVTGLIIYRFLLSY